MPDSPRPAHALVVFLDGVGLGPATAANPLVGAPPAFRRLSGGEPWTDALRPLNRPDHVVRPIDATLGVAGLPQSGTGQAALYTGRNAAALAGRHYGPFPHSATFDALRDESLWARLLSADVPREALCFANAYPAPFFDEGERRSRWPTAARMTREAGLRLRDEADVRDGTGLAADLTAEGWRRHLGIDVPVVTPEGAGTLLHALARAHRVTLFEFYHTDEAGHSQDAAEAASTLARVGAFVGAILDRLDAGRDLLVVTSDHGNLDDLSVRTHTRAPVPLIALGRGAGAFAGCASLVDVTPAIVQAATEPRWR